MTEPCVATIVAHDIGPVGGMETHLTQLISGLAARGWQIVVIARTCVLPPGVKVEFHRVPGPGRPLAIALPWFWLVAGVLVRVRGRGVVDTTGAILPAGPDVVTVHFLHAAAPRRFVRGGASAWLRNLNWWVSGGIARWLERRSLNHPGTTLVAISPGLADEISPRFPDSDVRVIFYGIDPERFSPVGPGRESVRSQFGIARDALMAVFVGGDWHRKRLANAIEAIGKVPEWSLCVVGRGDESAFRSLAASNGVADRIYFAGHRSDAELYYRAADAFVLPTAYETFSLVTAEAAASGLPLILTPFSRPPDILGDGANGWQVDGSSASIAGCLDRLRVDPGLRDRMGKESRRRALNYPWAAMVDQFEALFLELSGQVRGVTPT